MIGGSDIRRVSEMERQARQQAEPEAWPEGVIARYLTVVGATVDLTTDGTSRDYIDATDCTGCGWHNGYTTTKAARYEAQVHAEKCRALPRPAVTS